MHLRTQFLKINTKLKICIYKCTQQTSDDAADLDNVERNILSIIDPVDFDNKNLLILTYVISFYLKFQKSLFFSFKTL